MVGGDLPSGGEAHVGCHARCCGIGGWQQVFRQQDFGAHLAKRRFGVFKRVFTKADFLSYIDSGTKKHGALLGIVYVEAEGDWLFFAASVGSPDVTSDEYIPMVLKISRMGAVSISKDTQLDSAPSATASGQEEGGSEPMDDEDGEDGV